MCQLYNCFFRSTGKFFPIQIFCFSIKYINLTGEIYFILRKPKSMKNLTIILILTGFVFLQNGFGQKTQKADKYLITYNVLQEGEKDNYEVYVMNTDGTNKRNLTKHKDVAWTYYAYKNRIFFISDRDVCKRCYFLYEMDTNGENIRKVFDQRLEDSWMATRKNGSEIIVKPRLENKQQFYIVDVKTGKIIRELSPNLAHINDPTFSPNGKQIVFRGSTEKRTKDSKTFDELYIMNADGTGFRQLTTYPKDDKTAEWHSYHAGPPHWNTKENFITYQSTQNGKSSLYAVTPDGKKHWKLTDNELNEGWHDWSPDGKWLAIEMFDNENTEFGIYLMNYETKEIKKLTDVKDSKFQQAPVFVLKK